jgi:hypothetical protein
VPGLCGPSLPAVLSAALTRIAGGLKRAAAPEQPCDETDGRCPCQAAEPHYEIAPDQDIDGAQEQVGIEPGEVLAKILGESARLVPLDPRGRGIAGAFIMDKADLRYEQDGSASLRDGEAQVQIFDMEVVLLCHKFLTGDRGVAPLQCCC